MYTKELEQKKCANKLGKSSDHLKFELALKSVNQILSMKLVWLFKQKELCRKCTRSQKIIYLAQ